MLRGENALTGSVGKKAVVSVDLIEGDVLSLELRLGPAKSRASEKEKITGRAAAVDPGHIGRDGEWW